MLLINHCIHNHACLLLFQSTIEISNNFVATAINLSATRTVLSADVMSIMLSWNQPIGDFDPIITSYVIMGCTGSTSGNFLQCPTFSNITTLPSNVTQTTFNVSTTTDHIFNIIAVNMNGQSVLSSNVTVPRRKCIKFYNYA